MAGNFRERALATANASWKTPSLLLARHFDQQLTDFRAIQEDLVAYVQSTGIDYARTIQAPDVRARTFIVMLKTKIDALSYVGAINVFDADGVLINSSSAWPVPPVSVADRAWFKTFKSDPKSPSLVVEPVHSRVTGVWTTILARKVTGPNGEFLGSISRGIEPAHFEKFFASLALGDDATISMFHHDGTLLARHPHVEAMIGRNFKPGPLRQRALSEIELRDLAA